MMQQSPMSPPKISGTETLFLCRAGSCMPCENIAVWWGDVCIVVLDCFCDFKPKFLIKGYGIFIVCLDMQVNLRNVLLWAKIKNMIQQLCSCINQEIHITNLRLSNIKATKFETMTVAKCKLKCSSYEARTLCWGLNLFLRYFVHSENCHN